MRGKPRQATRSQRSARIIPAHAGQTGSYANCFIDSSDHPRACGANAPTGTAAEAPTGSSPRMRGKLCCVVDIVVLSRIIPAHAGQTYWLNCSRFPCPDHPRACGANRVLGQHVDTIPGSSPRMRGKLRPDCRIHGTPRIIPAHAGQTFITVVPFASFTDHPRACGANRPCTR